MGDVADILGVGGAAPATTPKPVKKEEKPKAKSKIHRELLLLQESKANHGLGLGLGGRVHVSSMPTTSLPLKKSLLVKSTQRVKWLRREFRNSARTDDLVLSHWVKAALPEGLEYPFARFNVTCHVTPVCSSDEFDKVLKDYVDPAIPQPWTYDETVALWAVCERYELRWVVVTDRYNFGAKHAARTMEDIKYWYYEATRLLSELRRDTTPAVVDEVPKIEVEAVEATNEMPEATAPDSTPSKDEGAAETPDEEETKEAEPATPPTEPEPAPVVLAPVVEKPVAYRFHIAYEKQRKAQLEVSFNRSNAEESAIKKLQEELKTIEAQLKKAVVRVDMKKRKELADVRHQIVHAPMPPGVYFRSTTQALPSTTAKMGLSGKLLRKMALVLEEFHMPPRPMPTKQVCTAYDSVRQDILGLLAVKKALAVKSNEVHALSAKYQAITGAVHVPRTQLHAMPLEGKADGGDAPVITTLVAPPSTAASKVASKGGSLKRKSAAAAPGSKRPSKKLA
ncbi:hypothetical protein SDRG_11001 [Saprolegnia diclina VS20]|uniref:Myb-like domain-containing protein n=1 Tax=Saprolegnia diclina (strain VS20) TaxID=1156394 RepID=T0QCX8_SAPDV|nr:hypothetical protein SDRG_11001 [Saprolegnia diclina VS20]EQC31400.1 hypothetical protein SDRG_11001 [Saprolegnia diclina VS20]|eukprot:XP_008615241.1 hypothetical protein SDRG_11001 [Saprolegnia diclina VS20]